MTKTLALTMGATLALGLVWLVGCGDEGGQPQEADLSGIPIDNLVKELGHVDQATRWHAARQLAERDASALKPILGSLKSALKDEKDPKIKGFLEQAISKAGG